jgi:hypothetical protein
MNTMQNTTTFNSPQYAPSAVFTLATKVPPINLMNVDQVYVILLTAQRIAAQHNERTQS